MNHLIDRLIFESEKKSNQRHEAFLKALENGDGGVVTFTNNMDECIMANTQSNSALRPTSYGKKRKPRK